MKKTLLILVLCFFVKSTAQCWQKIATGTHHCLAINEDGTLWSWGNNSHLQLGLGDNQNRNSPVKIGFDNDWVGVYAAEFGSFAIKANGTLWGWGANYNGQVGNGTREGVFYPMQIGTATNWKEIAAGFGHTVGIKTDGTLWAWGDNSYLQLGVGNYFEIYAPAQVGVDTNWKTASVSQYCTYAVKTDGSLWGSGSSTSGTFGAVPEANYQYLIRIGVDNDWDDIVAGNSYVLALKTNGSLWAWGRNDFGQLGDNTTTGRNVPQQVGTETWKLITCGNGDSPYCLAIRSDNTLWSWGYNGYGQLGNGTVVSVSRPRQIGSGTNWDFCTAGAAFTAALKQDNSLHMWGNNTYGQFGNGTNNSTPFTSPQYTSCGQLSVDQNKKELVRIYPNPASSVLHIDASGMEISKIVIVDITGKIIKEQDAAPVVNIESLERGIYMLTLISNNGSVNQKVVKN